jgi:penicillin-insensitive murein endopeptidase
MVHMTSFFPNPSSAVQAVGTAQQARDSRRTDRHAYLRNATPLSLDADGYKVLGQGMERYYGTYELVELIQQVGATYDELHPGGAIRVGDLSRRRGGTIRDTAGQRVHSSHRNGLDADVMYLHTDCQQPGDFDDPYCPIDVARSLELMNMFVAGGPYEDESLVDLFYVGSVFRERACRYLGANETEAERYRGVLERLQPMGGHESHFHVRIACPEHSWRCPPPRKYRPEFCPRLLSRLESRRDVSG